MLPPLVRRALELERALGLDRSCTTEAGRMLHVLAAERGRTRVAEIGARAGVGAAWLVSALRPDVPFVTTELDEARAAAVRELFRDDPSVRVLAGDWRATLPPEAPFDLVSVGATEQLRAREDADLVVGLLAPGGLAVLAGPTEAVRETWLAHPALAAVEVLTPGGDAVILSARR